MGLKKVEKEQLKSQFSKILEILTVDEPNCVIHNEFYCDKIYDDECCVNPSKCKECNLKSKRKADLIFENTEEDIRKFYVFGKKDRRKYVTSINTIDDIYSELAFLKAACIGNMDKDNLKYFRKVEALEEYAKDFFTKIIEECFPLIDKNILPIKFHQFLQNWNDYCKEKCTLGNYYRRQNQNIINIYETGTLEVDKLKLNIRHEIIHYCLDHSNLRNDDDTGVFHALCKLYDAGAYKEMNNQEQHIYDTFFKVYGDWEFIRAAYQEKGLNKNNYVQTLIIMAGSKDETIQKQFAEWKKMLEQTEQTPLKDASGF